MRPRIGHALALHGAGGGGWEWNAWRGVFTASGIELATPDLQPRPDGLATTTLDDYRQQARAALLALPRPRALVGASLGGLLAMLCADAADALVLVNPLPPLPWAQALPAREWPDLVPWRRDARLASTRRALPDADAATALFAYARWRDEAGAVLRAAQAGVEVAMPQCPVLCIASSRDEDVPPALTQALATAWQAGLVMVDAPSHVGPLLGRAAPAVAAQAAAWLSAR
ncbi:alpha/beta fold hydrolase [Lysobacter solisilvae (ex Woo and Kim 2020)]|uniref:Alpha/beta fold hydrolase n=1 Tax=Agrilutibacter terrestris TaxID=2865112 RepID=A0A7H0FYL4_9GAMM|nr:alpha/beta fold hydrolase [Lysobacter terrestris]QNP41130.1 alpha/beta fold hydrolase [Lysobacter terrestris]